MAWLAGIGIKETFGYLCRCDLKEFKKPPFKLAWVLVVWSAIVSMIMVRGPEKFRRGLGSISAAENAAENPIVLQMTQYRDGTRRVFIDRVIYAFHAKIPVPPELAVIPSKRIWSGQITPTEIIEKLEQYKPEQIVLFGSLRNQRELIDYVSAHYSSVPEAAVEFFSFERVSQPAPSMSSNEFRLFLCRLLLQPFMIMDAFRCLRTPLRRGTWVAKHLSAHRRSRIASEPVLKVGADVRRLTFLIAKNGKLLGNQSLVTSAPTVGMDFSIRLSGLFVVSAALFAWPLVPAGYTELRAELAPAKATNRFEHTKLLVHRNAAGELVPATNVEEWQQRRTAILAAMQEVMGPLPGKEKRSPLQMEVQEDVDCGTYVRRLITYRPEPKGIIPAYLLIPKEALTSARKFPAVLCLHQTHALGHKVVVGLGKSPNDEYGADLAKRGFVCLAPAYPRLANYQPDLKALGYQSGTMKAIWDNIRGLDLLETLPFVKPGSFGAIGHSLGGHNSIFTAVFDERIKVIISSCGFDSFRDYMGGNIKGWTSDRYMPRLLNYPLAEIPFDFHELVGALAPRPFFVSAPFYDTNFKWTSVLHIEEAAAKVYDLYGVRNRLRVEFPKCGHEFPIEKREVAYRLLEEQLR